MKKLTIFLGLILLASSIYYLVLPPPAFPPLPPGSLQSAEPADTETILRQAYYTNLSREEIMQFYDKQFKGSVPIQYRLDLPHEEAYSLIRDQTMSSYLEQIVHPWRESLYINVFVPTKPTEQINIQNVHYLNKITVRYLPSHPIPRLTVLLMSSIMLIWIAKEYAHV